LATVANTVISVLVNLPLLKAVWKNRRLSWGVHPDRATYHKILGYAIPTLMGGLLVTVVLWFTGTYLATQASLDEVGLYTVGSSLAAYLLFIPSAIGMPFIPIVSRLDRSDSPELPPFMMRTLRVTTFLLIPPTLILIGFPEPLLSILFGTAFMMAAPVVHVVAQAVFLAGISTIVGFGIAGKGQMWHGLLINLLWAIVFVVGSFVLVPTRAAVGLSLAYLASYGIQFLGILAYVRYSWSVSIRPLVVPLTMAFVSTAALLAVSYLIVDPWTNPVMAVVIVAVGLAELPAMSRREIEVLTAPIRKLILWFSPSQ
jgi:O-antigen/teichoic acid export membrane protein